jgi:hypothetical protein
MKDYIKQLEEQNEELRQMLANVQLELDNAKEQVKFVPTQACLTLAEKSIFLKRIQPDKVVPEFLQPICGILLVATIIGCIVYGMVATVENAREHREQQDNIKRWEQRIINARANKVEQ